MYNVLWRHDWQELEAELSGARNQKSVLEESSIVAFEEVEEKLKIIHEQERVSLSNVWTMTRTCMSVFVLCAPDVEMCCSYCVWCVCV